MLNNCAADYARAVLNSTNMKTFTLHSKAVECFCNGLAQLQDDDCKQEHKNKLQKMVDRCYDAIDAAELVLNIQEYVETGKIQLSETIELDDRIMYKTYHLDKGEEMEPVTINTYAKSSGAKRVEVFFENQSTTQSKLCGDFYYNLVHSAFVKA